MATDITDGDKLDRTETTKAQIIGNRFAKRKLRRMFTKGLNVPFCLILHKKWLGFSDLIKSCSLGAVLLTFTA